MYFLITFWVIIHLNIIKLSLRPSFRSTTPEKIHKYTQRTRCLRNRDFGCFVKQQSQKKPLNIALNPWVQIFFTKKKKLRTQVFFKWNIFVVATFFNKILIFSGIKYILHVSKYLHKRYLLREIVILPRKKNNRSFFQDHLPLNWTIFVVVRELYSWKISKKKIKTKQIRKIQPRLFLQIGRKSYYF